MSKPFATDPLRRLALLLSRCLSEGVLQSELDLTQLTRATHSAEAVVRGSHVLVAKCGRGRVPGRMIGSIEHLHPELKRVPLPETEILHRGEVDVPSGRTDQAIFPTGAVLTRRQVPKGIGDESRG